MPGREHVTGISLAEAGKPARSIPECQSLRARQGSRPSCLVCPQYLAGFCQIASVEASIEDLGIEPAGDWSANERAFDGIG